jgi:hypothetical protein
VADREEPGFKVTDRRRRDDVDPPSAATHPSGPHALAGDLRGLFVMLASQALYDLGEVPDPETREHHRDLARASEMIDLLMLLRSKTEGHLTADESETLNQLLYDLQVKYVGVTRSA